MLDHAGQRFGRWLVLRFIDRANRATRWLCRCNCGTERVVSGDSLRRGRSTNCGCARAETAANTARSRFTKHGNTANEITSTEYHSWAGMIARCTNPKHASFHNYGGRGIKVCGRWRSSFAAFLADMGQKPSRAYSIDRINNDGNYTPRNCRWATRKEQSDNSRRWSK